jgi:hypothetical protein
MSPQAIMAHGKQKGEISGVAFPVNSRGHVEARFRHGIRII